VSEDEQVDKSGGREGEGEVRAMQILLCLCRQDLFWKASVGSVKITLAAGPGGWTYVDTCRGLASSTISVVC
jgi:hypothetical protein